jgi:hypothetical protein
MVSMALHGIESGGAALVASRSGAFAAGWLPRGRGSSRNGRGGGQPGGLVGRCRRRDGRYRYRGRGEGAALPGQRRLTW